MVSISIKMNDPHPYLKVNITDKICFLCLKYDIRKLKINIVEMRRKCAVLIPTDRYRDRLLEAI